MSFARHIREAFAAHLQRAGLNHGSDDMKQIIIAALTLSALAPLSAHAQERMSDARYIAAQNCLAFASLTQLQSDQVEVSALREATTLGYRDSAVSSEARENARRVRARANNLATSANGLQELREQRDTACATFVERGLVQRQTQSSGSP
jgi:hypothetical protein